MTHPIKEPQENDKDNSPMSVSLQLYLISHALWPHVRVPELPFGIRWLGPVREIMGPPFFRVLPCQVFLVFLCEVVIWFEEVHFSEYTSSYRYSWKFCPSIGTKMEGRCSGRCLSRMSNGADTVDGAKPRKCRYFGMCHPCPGIITLRFLGRACHASVSAGWRDDFMIFVGFPQMRRLFQPKAII